MLTSGFVSRKVSIRSSFQPVPGPRKVSHFKLTPSEAGAAAPLSPAAGAAPGAAPGAHAAKTPAAVTKPLTCKKLRREKFLDIVEILLWLFSLVKLWIGLTNKLT